MRSIIITTAQTRKAVVWTPQEITWNSFCARLEHPLRGTEKYKDYLAMPKSQQDTLKDVGGYVGGRFVGQHRRAAELLGRDLITLDLDNIPAGMTDEVLSKVDALGVEAVVYSTRKHCDRKPRLRVIVLIDSEVTPDEYEPIARKVAEHIGIDYCDPTTFEGSRLMYWPSACADAEYVYRRLTGREVLSADAVLASYDDWRDVTVWPVVTGEETAHARSVARAEDPLSKQGIVGAFCRTYDIPRAMDELMPGLYTETTDPNRRTFAGGSTYGGAVIYGDGRFLYSHHATDPCGGRLVNAWDLVRIQKFSELDDEAKEGTPVSRMPSTRAMTELALGLPDVAAVYTQERVDRAREVFGTAVGAEATEKQNVPQSGSQSASQGEKSGQGADTTWMSSLALTEKGVPAKTITNCAIILENDPVLRGAVAMSETQNALTATRDLPWAGLDGRKRRRWTDADDANIHAYIETMYGIDAFTRIDEALEIVGARHSYNEVEEYLRGLTWDGVPRIDTLLMRYFSGVTDTPYTRAVMRKVLCAAVARALCDHHESVKFDYMPILVGPQGCGKSTFCRVLGKEWFSDSLYTFTGKEAAELLQGNWIVEVGELTAMSKQEVNAVKQFLSKEDDQYRAAYAHRTGKHPRRCVLIGTSNDVDFLKDQTGNRRFWPVDLGGPGGMSVWKDLPDEVDQIWAEAVVRYQLGESLELSKDETEGAQKAQEAHREEMPREAIIRQFLDRAIPEGWYEMSSDMHMAWLRDPANMNKTENDDGMMKRTKVGAVEVWVECLGGSIISMDRRATFDINAIIRSTPGWVESSCVRFGKYYGRGRGFVRKEG